MVKALWVEFQGRSYLMRGLQILLICLIFAFLFRNPYLNWSELSIYQWSLNYLALAGSLFLLLADAFLYAYLWRRILLRFGGFLGYREALRIVFLWVINGIAYYLLINSLTPSPPSHLPMVVGAFTIAWVVGFLALFAPAGLGVVEATLALLLGFQFSVPVATVVALFTRLIRTIAELICTLIAWRL